MRSTFPPFDLIFWENNKNPVQKNLHGIFRGIVICLLIVLCSEFKVCFWMSAYWANFWSFFAKVNVTTVAADPSFFAFTVCQLRCFRTAVCSVLRVLSRSCLLLQTGMRCDQNLLLLLLLRRLRTYRSTHSSRQLLHL